MHEEKNRDRKMSHDLPPLFYTFNVYYVYYAGSFGQMNFLFDWMKITSLRILLILFKS